MSNFPIKAEQFFSVAKKAVVGYVGSTYPKFFSSEEIEDMTSDVVTRMWRSQDSYKSEKGELSTWVRAIAQNVVKTQAKAKYLRSPFSFSYDREDFVDSSYSPYEADREVETEDAERMLFDALPSERDQMMLCWKLEGLTPKEIAKRAGVTENTVYLVFHHLKKRISRAA